MTIESDCATAVAAMRGTKPDRSSLRFVVEEGKELSTLLVDWKMNQVKRGE